MPSENTEQRKLAAIMFTDMVGYSALSQRNEALALELLAENQRLLRSQFPLFNGREVKTTGDGFLVEFPSALQATQCAVEIQRAVVARNATQPGDRHFDVRIGIHVGDVVHREADMYGDGVNIAARIEPLAIGGGICLSDTVYAQVRNKLDVGLTKLNSPELKHIEVPMDVYRVVLPWQQRAPVAGKSGSPKRPSLVFRLAPWIAVLVLGVALAVSLMRRPAASPTRASQIRSLAVLPFAFETQDPKVSGLGKWIPAEIRSKLGPLQNLQVVNSPARIEQLVQQKKSEVEIARELGVDGLVMGELHGQGETMSAYVWVVDGSTGRALGKQREIASAASKVSELPNQVALAIVDELKLQVSDSERTEIRAADTQNAEAFLAYQRGRDLNSSRRFGEAAVELRRALQLDANYTQAWALLAVSEWNPFAFGGTTQEMVATFCALKSNPSSRRDGALLLFDVGRPRLAGRGRGLELAEGGDVRGAEAGHQAGRAVNGHPFHPAPFREQGVLMKIERHEERLAVTP